MKKKVTEFLNMLLGKRRNPLYNCSVYVGLLQIYEQV